MPADDNRNFWIWDARPIIAACLLSYPADDGILLASDGWAFERFERSGEMASIPYLRATKDGLATEAPLTNWAWVQFEETKQAEHG